MTGITNKNVVDFYINTHKDDKSDKVYPNLMLVRSYGFLSEKGNKNILDYGCGYGANALFLLQKGAHVTIADTSIYAIQKTTKKFNDNGFKKDSFTEKLIEKDSKKLPFDDNSFDIITCLSVLSLLSNQTTIESLLAEFRRVLKPEGRIFIDINGQDSEFAVYSNKVSDNIFEYKGRNKNLAPILAFCPVNEKKFQQIVEQFFNILEIGRTEHSLFGFKEQEFIAICEK